MRGTIRPHPERSRWRDVRSLLDLNLPPLVDAERELAELSDQRTKRLIGAAVLTALAAGAAVFVPQLWIVLAAGAVDGARHGGLGIHAPADAALGARAGAGGLPDRGRVGGGHGVRHGGPARAPRRRGAIDHASGRGPGGPPRLHGGGARGARHRAEAPPAARGGRPRGRPGRPAPRRSRHHPPPAHTAVGLAALQPGAPGAHLDDALHRVEACVAGAVPLTASPG